MTECNAIIEANNEIDKLKRENEKLNALCVEYGFEMGRLEEENEQLKNEIEKLSYANEDLLEEKRIWKQMSDENEMIRNTINEMYKNERTELGKSVLKQLIEAIQ